MNIHTILATLACLIGVQFISIQPAGADEVIYDGSGFLRGQQSFSDAFSVDGPGTLTVTLTNEDWPVPLASLNLTMSAPGTGLLGPEMGAGTATFKVVGASEIFAQWFGTAQGTLDAGTYGVQIDFSPTVVPLPASIALLLSGLALLAWQRRTRMPNNPSLTPSG